jgi:hypothetical protein
MLQRREDEPQERGCGYTEGGIRGRYIRIEGEEKKNQEACERSKKRERERERERGKLLQVGEMRGALERLT